MSRGRRAGQTRQTSAGVDDLAGAHGRRPGTRAKRLEDGLGEAGAAEGLPPEALPENGARAPDPADVPDLDARERQQAASRKPSGPAKRPTQAAIPMAPPPDSPPPTDPT